MNYNDIIEKLASGSGLTEEQSARTVSGFIEALRTCAKDLDAVAIPGFGTFQPVKNQEYVVTDPEKGTRTLMPPSVEVKFKSSVVLRKKLLG